MKGLALLMFALVPVPAALCVFFFREAATQRGDLFVMALLLGWVSAIATGAVIGVGVATWRDGR